MRPRAIASVPITLMLALVFVPVSPDSEPARVIIGLIDTGVPWNLEAFKQEADAMSAFADEFPLGAHPLDLRCLPRCDHLESTLEERKLYALPGSRIVGAISFAAEKWGPHRLLDDSGHGTMTASLIASDTFGYCQECYLVIIKGPSLDALQWALEQTWIDIVVAPWATRPGTDANATAMLHASQAFAARGGSVVVAASTVQDAGAAAKDPLTGPSWHFVVGAEEDGKRLAPGSNPIVTFVTPLPAQCHRNATAPCTGAGTSAATAAVAGVIGGALLHERQLVQDVGTGPRGQGIIVEGPITRCNPSGVLTQKELWENTLSAFAGGPSKADGRYGVLHISPTALRTQLTGRTCA